MKNNQIYKTAVREMIKSIDWQSPYAVTLTFKTVRVTKNGRSYIDRYACQQNLRHFLNVLNNKIHRNKVRSGLTLKTISVLEMTDFVRPHYHLLIEKPKHVSELRFLSLIRNRWPLTNWGNLETKAEACDAAGWASYITKDRTKNEYDLCIDWSNSYWK